MILHRLIWRFLRHGDDLAFYRMQAEETVRWMVKRGLPVRAGTRVLDLGCGHGFIGSILSRMGCEVTFADVEDSLVPECGGSLVEIDVEKDDLASLGTYDLVVFSNVFEHLAGPREFLKNAGALLEPGGYMYLSWTNWLSPFGGHEFVPFHYLGPRLGPWVYDRVRRAPRKYQPFVNLFPTYIGRTLRMIRGTGGLRIVRVTPRYSPEFEFITRVPVLREFLTFNCVILIQKCG